MLRPYEMGGHMAAMPGRGKWIWPTRQVAEEIEQRVEVDWRLVEW